MVWSCGLVSRATLKWWLVKCRLKYSLFKTWVCGCWRLPEIVLILIIITIPMTAATYPWHTLCAGHCAVQFTYISSLNPHNHHYFYYYSLFASGENGAWWIEESTPKLIQWGRAGTSFERKGSFWINSLLCPLLSMWMPRKKVSQVGDAEAALWAVRREGQNQERSWLEFGIWVLREN